MYASNLYPSITKTDFFRWVARVSGGVLIACWVTLVGMDAVRSHFVAPTSVAMYLQAAAFAVVFVGYAIGWKHELAGGLVAIAGFLAFAFVAVFDAHTIPNPAVALFAAPGVLYLLARYYDDRERALKNAE